MNSIEIIFNFTEIQVKIVKLSKLSKLRKKLTEKFSNHVEEKVKIFFFYSLRLNHKEIIRFLWRDLRRRHAKYIIISKF